jgi:ribonuclease P protein subunit POP4
MRTKANLARHEWIGLEARVEASLDPSQGAAAGLVVDESLHTVTLERPDGREVKVPKRGTRMAFTLPQGERAALDLTALEYRPWDRVKRAKAAHPR